MLSHISRQKKWRTKPRPPVLWVALTKRCNLCLKGIERTPTFGFILKTNDRLVKNSNELLVVGSSKTNKFN